MCGRPCTWRGPPLAWRSPHARPAGTTQAIKDFRASGLRGGGLFDSPAGVPSILAVPRRSRRPWTPPDSPPCLPAAPPRRTRGGLRPPRHLSDVTSTQSLNGKASACKGYMQTWRGHTERTESLDLGSVLRRPADRPDQRTAGGAAVIRRPKASSSALQKLTPRMAITFCDRR